MKCNCCSHRERPAIDLAIARGVSVSALSRRYDMSTDSLYRHAKNHLPPQLRAKLIAGPDIETSTSTDFTRPNRNPCSPTGGTSPLVRFA
jgi:hypothetical protein